MQGRKRPIKIEKDGFQQNWYFSQQGDEQIKFTFLKDFSNVFSNSCIKNQ
jgi:hypothetical protein